MIVEIGSTDINDLTGLLWLYKSVQWLRHLKQTVNCGLNVKDNLAMYTLKGRFTLKCMHCLPVVTF